MKKRCLKFTLLLATAIFSGHVKCMETDEDFIPSTQDEIRQYNQKYGFYKKDNYLDSLYNTQIEKQKEELEAITKKEFKKLTAQEESLKKEFNNLSNEQNKISDQHVQTIDQKFALGPKNQDKLDEIIGRLIYENIKLINQHIKAMSKEDIESNLLLMSEDIKPTLNKDIIKQASNLIHKVITIEQDKKAPILRQIKQIREKINLLHKILVK